MLEKRSTRGCEQIVSTISFLIKFGILVLMGKSCLRYQGFAVAERVDERVVSASSIDRTRQESCLG